MKPIPSCCLTMLMCLCLLASAAHAETSRLNSILKTYAQQRDAQVALEDARNELAQKRASLEEVRGSCDSVLSALGSQEAVFKSEADRLGAEKDVKQGQYKVCREELKHLKKMKAGADQIAQKESQCRALDEAAGALKSQTEGFSAQKMRVKGEYAQKDAECSLQKTNLKAEIELLKDAVQQAGKVLRIAGEGADIAIGFANRTDTCGNRLCGRAENDLRSCPADCGTSPVVCNDGVCGLNEVLVCPHDCARIDWGRICPDGICMSVPPDTGCGNGVLRAGEQCDDGNTVSGDGCSSACLLECFTECRVWCGDGIITYGEECDDRNKISGDGCSSACRVEPPPTATCYACGTGDTCSSVTGATAFCATMFGTLAGCEAECGDSPPTPEVTCYACGITGCEEMRAPESLCSLFYDTPTCDERCPVATIEPECGNGAIEAGEACDDGNTTAGDGCDAVCRIEPDGPDRELCDEATSGVELPPGTRLRPYPDAMHVSVCETETTVRYLICGDDGTVTVSVGECRTETPCENGACEDDPGLSAPTCEDSDGGQFSDIPGRVTGTRGDGRSYESFDACTSEGTHVIEQYCLDGRDGYSIILCDAGEHCEDPPGYAPGDEARCVPGEAAVPTCDDSDGGQFSDIPGRVTGTRGDGRSYESFDACTSEGTHVIEQYCLDGRLDGRDGYSIILCDAGEHCEDPPGYAPGDEARCVPGEAAVPTCDDSDGGQFSDIPGRVTGTHGDGRSYESFDACTSEGTHVLEQYCLDGRLDGRDGYSIILCDTGEHCEDPPGYALGDEARCVSGCVCSRTMPTGGTEVGFVTGRDCVVQHDICEGETLIRFACGMEGMPAVSETVTCSTGCRDGLCL